MLFHFHSELQFYHYYQILEFFDEESTFDYFFSSLYKIYNLLILNNEIACKMLNMSWNIKKHLKYIKRIVNKFEGFIFEEY